VQRGGLRCSAGLPALSGGKPKGREVLQRADDVAPVALACAGFADRLDPVVLEQVCLREAGKARQARGFP
jgi:hypothetical protein